MENDIKAGGGSPGSDSDESCELYSRGREGDGLLEEEHTEPTKQVQEADDTPATPAGCCQRLSAWLRSAFFYIYCSRILSGWVTQMWYFALGVLLVNVTNDSLLLTAIYGFSSGGSVILFGAVVGDWMDKHNRLMVARTTVVIRNLGIVLSSIILCFMIAMPEAMATVWNGWLKVICKGLVVIFADVAYLATTGNIIAIERDWVVEISGRKRKVLAGMNAIFRRIDLAMAVLIPLAVGQIMTYASLLTSAIFICGFNVVAAVVEYFILKKVYDKVPALSRAKDKLGIEENIPTSNEEDGPLVSSPNDQREDESKTKQEDISAHRRRVLRIFDSFITLYKGWRCYMRQSIRLAGLGLACLYMTVLSFHYLTAGYAYAQGLNESTIGIVSALDAGVGFLGTFGFQFLRSKVGLVRTGVISLGWQVSCLTLCVASVWAPGSPFMNLFNTTPAGVILNCSAGEFLSNHSYPSNLSFSSNLSKLDLAVTTTAISDNTDSLNPATFSNGSSGSSLYNETCRNSTNVDDGGVQSYTHIGMLIAGIVASRFGLWSADLTVTQLFLENVKSTERGIVNGVQSSINMLMDVVRFAIVIVAPRPETFGFLVLLSYCFVSLGLVLYCVYARQEARRIRRGCREGETEVALTAL